MGRGDVGIGPLLFDRYWRQRVRIFTHSHTPTLQFSPDDRPVPDFRFRVLPGFHSGTGIGCDDGKVDIFVLIMYSRSCSQREIPLVYFPVEEADVHVLPATTGDTSGGVGGGLGRGRGGGGRGGGGRVMVAHCL